MNEHRTPQHSDARSVDLPQRRRPGVPMEHKPRKASPATDEVPARQPPAKGVLKRAGAPSLPPVFGTGEPPRGLSGLLRRRAYAIPDHWARHWAYLLLADKVDVREARLRRLGKRLAMTSALFFGGAWLLGVLRARVAS